MKPTGAVLIKNDGERIPLELVCEGINDEGIEVWGCMTPLDRRTDRVHVDVLPPHTAIRFPVDGS